MSALPVDITNSDLSTPRRASKISVFLGLALASSSNICGNKCPRTTAQHVNQLLSNCQTRDAMWSSRGLNASVNLLNGEFLLWHKAFALQVLAASVLQENEIMAFSCTFLALISFICGQVMCLQTFQYWGCSLSSLLAVLRMQQIQEKEKSRMSLTNSRQVFLKGYEAVHPWQWLQKGSPKPHP